MSSFTAFSSASAGDIPFIFTGAAVRFLSTFMLLKRLNCWNTMPIFWRCRFMSVFLSQMFTSSNIISPLVGFSRRLRHLRKVLLPPPEGPIMAATLPRSKVVDISFNTSRLPKDLQRWFTCIMGLLCSIGHLPFHEGYEPAAYECHYEVKYGSYGKRFEAYVGHGDHVLAAEHEVSYAND